MVLAFAVALTLAGVGPLYAQGTREAAKPGWDSALNIPSKTYRFNRQAWVYTPKGYPASCQDGCNLLIAFDGRFYRDELSLPKILDSLIAARRIPPTVAVMFDNEGAPGRIADLANAQRFARFVAEELLPWVETHYRVRRTPDSRILAGTSAGGLAAAYIAFRYPTVFGNVLSQSGAFWRSNESSDQPPYEWLTQQLANAPKLPVKFYLDVGTRETDRALGGAAPSQLDSNRRLHGVLKAKGYAVKYVEVQNGGHSAESWRQQLPIALVALAPVARPPDSLPAPASSGGR